MYQNIPTKVLTGEVRLSYCNLVTPKANQRGQLSYSVMLLIPKSDTATKADIDASILAAYEQGVVSKWAGARPNMQPVIYDGDGLRHSGTAFSSECKGHWVLNAKTSQKPQVVGIDNISCELAPQDIYSGMYARVTLNFFPFDAQGNKGVSCGLGNVLKTRDGEPLSGGASASSDFSGLGQPAPQPPPQFGQTQPQFGQTQPQFGQTQPQFGQPQPMTAEAPWLSGPAGTAYTAQYGMPM